MSTRRSSVSCPTVEVGDAGPAGDQVADQVGDWLPRGPGRRAEALDGGGGVDAVLGDQDAVGLLDRRPVLQTACSCSACRPLTPSTTSSTSLRPASPTPPSTDDPHAGDPGPPAPADPHDQGRLALSMSSTVRSTGRDMSAPHSREISSTSHFVAALAIPCSDWPACFAAERNSFGGPSGPVRGSTGRRPRRLRIDGREPLGLDQGVPDETQCPPELPYLRRPAGSPAARSLPRRRTPFWSYRGQSSDFSGSWVT